MIQRGEHAAIRSDLEHVPKNPYAKPTSLPSSSLAHSMSPGHKNAADHALANKRARPIYPETLSRFFAGLLNCALCWTNSSPILCLLYIARPPNVVHSHSAVPRGSPGRLRPSLMARLGHARLRYVQGARELEAVWFHVRWLLFRHRPHLRRRLGGGWG